jgi:hypothetical protein
MQHHDFIKTPNIIAFTKSRCDDFVKLKYSRHLLKHKTILHGPCNTLEFYFVGNTIDGNFLITNSAFEVAEASKTKALMMTSTKSCFFHFDTLFFTVSRYNTRPCPCFASLLTNFCFHLYKEKQITKQVMNLI